MAGVKFGLEAFLGLVPVVGDTVGVLAGLYPLWVANRHKLGKAVQAKMAANLAVEWSGGLIPWVGDFFDVAYKANLRNVKLLEAEIAKRREQPSGAQIRARDARRPTNDLIPLRHRRFQIGGPLGG